MTSASFSQGGRSLIESLREMITLSQRWKDKTLYYSTPLTVRFTEKNERNEVRVSGSKTQE